MGKTGGYGRLWLWEAGGYGRLVVMEGWWLWGRLTALMGRICLICPIKPITPISYISPIRLLGFSSLLKTETAIRDFGWLFALVCYEKFERTLKLHSFGCCFTKHDLYRESIEIIFFRCLGTLYGRLCFCSQRSLFDHRCGVVYRRCGVHGALLQRVYGCRIGVSH